MNTKNEHDLSERPRRPYEPPAIEESGDFERLVLMCGHHEGDLDCDNSSPTTLVDS